MSSSTQTEIPTEQEEMTTSTESVIN
jgi:hypothetical protein